jgi:uncharacterized membrane protein YhhN
MKNQIIVIIAVFVAAMQLLGCTGIDGFEWLHILSKPLIVPLGFAWFILNYPGKETRYVYSVTAAMLFSLLGDVLLIFDENPSFFTFGLLSFMIAHLFYIYAFSQAAFHVREIPLLRRMPLLSIPYLAIGYWVFYTLRNDLNELKFAVFVYIVVLLGMALAALNRYNRVGKYSFTLVFSGSALFLLSDTILALNRFHTEIPMGMFWIMITYMGAQWLFARGLAQNHT